jgi:hypothetical protein
MATRFRRSMTLLIMSAVMGLSGCSVVSVVDAGVSVAATAVSTAASVAGTAVSATAKVGGAVIDALTPESKKDDGGKK